MASNLQLTELEQRVLDYVKHHPASSEFDVLTHNRGLRSEILQALSNLIAQSYVSADEDLRYAAVGGSL